MDPTPRRTTLTARVSIQVLQGHVAATQARTTYCASAGWCWRCWRCVPHRLLQGTRQAQLQSNRVAVQSTIDGPGRLTGWSKAIQRLQPTRAPLSPTVPPPPHLQLGFLPSISGRHNRALFRHWKRSKLQLSSPSPSPSSSNSPAPEFAFTSNQARFSSGFLSSPVHTRTTPSPNIHRPPNKHVALLPVEL